MPSADIEATKKMKITFSFILYMILGPESCYILSLRPKSIIKQLIQGT